MVKIEIEQQNLKKQFNFKKILRLGFVLALVFIVIGLVFTVLPSEQPAPIQPQQQLPQEYYNVSMELIENSNGYKYLKLENTGKDINDATDFLIMSYPPEALIKYGIPECSITTNDFDFIYFNKNDVIYYYFNSNDETLHLSKSIPMNNGDFVDGKWRFDLIINGNIINSKYYDIQNSRLKICDNTTNIASAIRKASDYDTILLTGNEYYEHLVIDKPIYIKGKNKPILNGGNTDDTITIKSNNVYISGLSFKNSGMSLYNAAITAIGINNVTIKNCDFKNNANGIYIYECTNFKIYNNIFTDNTGDGILLQRSNYNLIRSNTFYNNNNGIYLTESDLNYIKENSVDNHNEYGIFIEKHGAFDNICEYNYWGHDDCYCNKIIIPTDYTIFQNDPMSICGIYSKTDAIITSEWELYLSELLSDEQLDDNNVGYYNF